MINVAILINGKPLYTRSAVNISKDEAQPQQYKIDTGQIINHHQKDGAIRLAKKLLETIQET